jgi:hypothetical protein
MLLLLDVSGSMSDYSREAAHDPKSVRPKWRQAVRTIDTLLAQQNELQSLAVIAIGEPSSERTVERIFPTTGLWASVSGEKGLGVLGEAVQAMLDAPTRGGSAHGWVIPYAIKTYVVDTSEPADTVLIVTDGLPNHGLPVVTPTSGDLAGNRPPSGFVWVSAEDKCARAEYALQAYRNALNSIPNDRRQRLRVYVLCVHWPDDRELMSFALALASECHGLVLYLSPEQSAE